MRKKYDDLEWKQYISREREIRKQLIPPILFFVAVGGIVLFSVVKHNQKVDAGGEELTTDAILVDYMSAAVGLTVYENTDELDDSYGDYFYLGADFYETGKGTTIEIYDHEGTVVFEGEDMVERFCWTCDDSEVTQEEVDTMADELSEAYGAYEKDADGGYTWYASEDGMLGENENLAQISCGLNDEGVLVIEGSMQKF